MKASELRIGNFVNMALAQNYPLESQTFEPKKVTTDILLGNGSTSGGRSRLANLMAGKSMEPFIKEGFTAMLDNPIKFIPPHGGNAAFGYDAEILQTIVRALSKAFLSGKLSKVRENIGRNAEQLDDAFSKVGLIALIDEATGYQYERERDEL